MHNLKFLFILFAFVSEAQQQKFDPLITWAWQHSVQLKSMHFQLQSAEASLRESKAMYGPVANFGIQYSLADGGRNISIPVGDLLNPVYNSLNQITMSNAFPQIANVEEQLLPDNFYDMRLRISQPLFYPDLLIQKRIMRNKLEWKQLEIKAFKRLLSRDVMQAVFQLQTAMQLLEIYNTTDTLLKEAHRTTQSLIRNGVALPSALSRISSQLAGNTAQRTEIEAQIGNAKAYLQFLTGIATDSLEHYVNPGSIYPADLSDKAQMREELQQLGKGIDMQKWALKKENQFYLPRIGAQLDLGSQDFDFGFSPYVLFGLNLEWNVFDSKRHSYRKQMVRSEMQSLETKKEEVTEQIELQKEIAKRNYHASVSQAQSYEQRISDAGKMYKEVFAKYREGSSNYLELIDAQSQWTQMRLQHAISILNAWTKWSEYQYVNASYPIE